MPNPPKIFVHNTVVLVSTRMEEGLPLVPTRSMNAMIESVLAAGKQLFPVNLVAYCYQFNHLHKVLHVINPEDVSRFVGYVKQEIAHRVNRLLGRRKRTIWVEGFDSPTILSAETVFQKIAYTLCNPVKDNLVEHIDKSPFVSSWGMLKTKCFTYESKYIPRDQVPQLRDPSRPWREDKEVFEHFKTLESPTLTLELSPYSWKRAFAELARLSDDEIHALTMRAVGIELEDIDQARKQAGWVSFGSPEELRRQSMLRKYQPKKFGRRMLCLALNKSVRIPFIRMVKNLVQRAKAARSAWLRGDYSVSYPPGVFPAGRPPVASLLPGSWW